MSQDFLSCLRLFYTSVKAKAKAAFFQVSPFIVHIESWQRFVFAQCKWALRKVTVLGSVYTKRQHQRCDDATENWLQPQSGVTPLFSMRTESLAPSQSGRSVDADAWCKQTLNGVVIRLRFHSIWIFDNNSYVRCFAVHNQSGDEEILIEQRSTGTFFT